MGEWSPSCLVIGKMGSGKSFVCNILLGRDTFRSATSKNQLTVNVETERSIYQLKGCKDFFVTDTPDFQTPAGNCEARNIQNTITYESTFLVYVANWDHILPDLLGFSDCVDQQFRALPLEPHKFRGSVAVLTHVPKDTHDQVSSDKIYRDLDSKFKGKVETIIQDISLTDSNRSNIAQKIIRHLGLSFVERSPEKSLTEVDSRPDSTGSHDSLQSMHFDDNRVRDHKNIGTQTSGKARHEASAKPDSMSLNNTPITGHNVESQQLHGASTKFTMGKTSYPRRNAWPKQPPGIYEKAEAWSKAPRMGTKKKAQSMASVADKRPKTEDHMCVNDGDVMHFVNTLKRGKSKNSHVPVIVVGPRGVGKTSLIHNLMGQSVREEKQTKCFEFRRSWSKVYMDKDGKLVRRDTKTSYEEDLNHQTMANAMKSAQVYAECDESDEENNCEEEHCNVNATKSIQYTVYDKQSSIYLEDDEFASDELRDNDAAVYLSNATSQKLNVGKENLDSSYKRLDNLDMVYIKNVLCKKEHSSCDYLYVSYLDFAGDYYNLHQPYMRPNAVYLVVLDLSEPLDALMKESESYKGDKGILRHTVTGCLKFWLTSIHTYATSNQRGPPKVLPPVIVICTHGENVQSDEEKDKCKKEIWKHINRSPVAKGHVKDVIFISNTSSPKTEFDVTLECILRHANERAGFKREISAQWIYLEKIILERKYAGSKTMSFEEMESIDASSIIPIGDSSRLRIFLEYQHEQGKIIYFDNEELRDLIVLDTALPMEFMQCLVQTSPFSSLSLQKRLQEFGSSIEGLIDDVYIQECTEHATKEVGNFRDYFIKIGIFYDVLQEFRLDGGRRGQYLIPGFLPTQPLENVMHISQGCESTLDIAINFNSPSPPLGYFYRLISAAFGKWQVIKLPQKDGGLQLYHGYARFSLQENQHFWLHVYLRSEEILIKGEYISQNMKCVESYGVDVLDFLLKQTQEMPQAYGERQKATLIVRCPDHDTEISLEKLVRNKSERCTWNQITHLISIKDLFKTNKMPSEACAIL